MVAWEAGQKLRLTDTSRQCHWTGLAAGVGLGGQTYVFRAGIVSLGLNCQYDQRPSMYTPIDFSTTTRISFAHVMKMPTAIVVKAM